MRLLRHRVDDVMDLYQMLDRLQELLLLLEHQQYLDGKEKNFRDVLNLTRRVHRDEIDSMNLVRRHPVLFARSLGDFVPDAHLTLVDVLDRFEVDVLLDVTDDVLVGVALLHPLLMKMDYYRREVDVALQRKDWRLVVSAFL
jgi:hypothetical protein